MTERSRFQSADIGIVGGGQLARMMAQAAIPLGVRLRVLAARADDSAAQVCSDVVVGSPDDPDVLSAFARDCRVVTFDHELVPAAALSRLNDESVCLRPSPVALAFAQDKGWQRERLGALGYPVPPHRTVSDRAEITAFAEEHKWPVVVKTPRGGYDGRGVWIIESPAQAADVADRLGRSLLVEPWLPIEREVAVMVARRPSGQVATYPVVETVQVDGICHEVIAPAPISDAMAAEAGELAKAIAEAIGLVGVMAVELFVAKGRLLLNELATRPHNSGHFSIEGCVTSQFEQHLRAVLDWPLGSTTLTAPVAVMVNVLGGPDGADPRDLRPHALAIDGVHVHLYGKDARHGRKLGHVTVLGDDEPSVRERAARAASILAGVVEEARR
ncbi:MAG: 5-(carboxyamino)imidazole ribonucleotide synthase [Thermomicrobiales bacterium]